jgi:signal peptidase II
MERSRPAGVLFSAVIALVVLVDVVSKAMAVRLLHADPIRVIGDVVRVTLVYNRGAAFGINVGEYSRWVFLALTVGALVILFRLYRATRPGDQWRTLALALVCGGAFGNLIDRVSPYRKSVVDFIDVGVGQTRWPTFNVADMAVSVGAILLAFVLWGEDRRAAVDAALASSSPGTGGTATSGLVEDRREAL